MKITIGVELDAKEIPLATELFQALRQITDRVSPKNSKQLFIQLLRSLEEDGTIESVAADITRLLIDVGNNEESVFEEFFESFVEIVFAPPSDEVVQVIPYMMLLPAVPDPQRQKFRDRLVSYVMTHLTIARNVQCNRMEFFAHAEVFAALVKLEFLHIEAAVTEICSLLRNPDTRSAGITMLGKTVEICLPLLLKQCDRIVLDNLRNELVQIREPCFSYDIAYVMENMNWNSEMPSSEVPAAEISSPVLALTPTNSFMGHTNTVFTCAYDSNLDSIISADKDGAVITWTPEGQVAGHISLKPQYACSMDMNVRNRSLLVCRVPDKSTPPAIMSYSLDQNNQLTWNATINNRRPVKLVSCVRSLADASCNHFITGETIQPEAGAMPVGAICYYDADSAPFKHLTPTVTFTEHNDIVTCLAVCDSASNIFLSGSRDGTIKLWDSRVPSSVGTFGGGTSMITCVDTKENLMVSAGLDNTVSVWDFRSLGAVVEPRQCIVPDDSAILKVSMASVHTAATSTLNGLYMIDLDSSAFVVSQPFSDGRSVRRYHDLQWNNGGNTLFAAGDDRRIDVYSTTV